MKKAMWPLALAGMGMLALPAGCRHDASEQRPNTRLTLTEDRQTEYAIVLREDPIPAERTAAAELQKYLLEITGVTFPVLAEGETHEGPKLFVGAGAAVRDRMPQVPWENLAGDRIILRTSGRDLVLAGSRPRGTLYAVFSFLEDALGCRWWTATDRLVPRRETLTIPKLNVDYAPPFHRLRNPYYREVYASPEFSAQLRTLLPTFYPRGEPWGDPGTLLTGYHTFFHLLPPDEYFAAHPEWYSEIHGERRHAHGQLCLTNPEMLNEMIVKVRALLQETPRAIVMIGQEDYQAGSRCTCAACLAVEAEEDAMSGPIIRFVNEVAAAIEDEYPEARIMTFAYLYSEKPPRAAKPRENVVIMLCPFNASRWHPYNSEGNADFRDHFLRWAEISNEIFIWDYRSNYSNYLEIYPNYWTLEEDLRFFADHKVSGVFIQGDRYCEIGDMVKLRAWVSAHMLWNPDRDLEQLTREFLEGYYAEAAPALWEYLQLVHTSGMHAGRTQAAPRPEILKQAAAFYREALAAVAHDETLTDRVHQARTSLETSTLQLALLGLDMGETLALLDCRDVPELVDLFRAKCDRFADSFYREHTGSLPTLAARYEMLAHLPKIDPPVIPGVDLDRERWFDIQHWSLGAHVSHPHRLVDDPEASNGKATLMQGNSPAWNVMYLMQPALLQAAGIRDMTVYVRAKVLLSEPPARPEDKAFEIGFHSVDAGETRTTPLRYNQVDDGAYRYYRLDKTPVDGSSYIWACASGTHVEHIYFDRIVLVDATRE